MLKSKSLILKLYSNLKRSLGFKPKKVCENDSTLENFREKIDYYVYYDSLTGLLNRSTFMEQLSRDMPGNTLKSICVVSVDIDNFKLVNDSMGHDFGDNILKEAAIRFKKHIHRGIAFRLDGDEFAAILLKCDSEFLQYFVDSLMKDFNEPFIANGYIAYLTLSIGAAFVEENDKNLKEAFKCADIALNEAKKSGRNRCVLFADTISSSQKERNLICN